MRLESLAATRLLLMSSYNYISVIWANSTKLHKLTFNQLFSPSGLADIDLGAGEVSRIKIPKRLY